MKSYYELLGLDRTADAETIKRVFRKEIARYHPDKVQHLGQEFQEMASERASLLTAAYKTLTDPELRRQYDETLAAGGAPAAPTAAPAAPSEPAQQASSAAPSSAAAPSASPDYYIPPEPPPVDAAKDFRRFERDRAGRDAIVRRAILGKVQDIVEQLYGDVETPAVKTFDLAVVPKARARLLGSAPPRVLVRVSDAVDMAGVGEAWGAAARAGIHAQKSPVVVLLFGHKVAPQAELMRGLEQAQRQPRPSGGPEEIAVVALGVNDWNARLSPGASAAVRKLVEKLHA